jgi:hypothetical protein
VARYVIPDRGRGITIEADLLAEASSYEIGKRRWGEYRLFRLTRGSGYVLAGVGRSIVDGEVDRPWSRICETPDSVIRALLYEKRPGVWVLPPSGRSLLESAAAVDPGIRRVVPDP